MQSTDLQPPCLRVGSHLFYWRMWTHVSTLYNYQFLRQVLASDQVTPALLWNQHSSHKHFWAWAFMLAWGAVSGRSRPRATLPPCKGWRAYTPGIAAAHIRTQLPCSQQDAPNASAVGRVMGCLWPRLIWLSEMKKELTHSSRRFFSLAYQCVGGRKRNILMNYSPPLFPLEWTKEWR